jgi:hypothetical protein
MKIGLVTFYYAHHYGAQLQAYALMKAIEKQPFGESSSYVDSPSDTLYPVCEIVDYVRPDTIEASNVFQKITSLRGILRSVHSLLHYTSLKRRYDRFSNFIMQNMQLSASSYRTPQSLIDSPPNYDLFVCGSDQVWNPAIYPGNQFDPSFFMTFTQAPKVSYAPSFGISSIPEQHKEELKGYLHSFKALSVREYEGADIIKLLTDKEAPVVLDPTLLLTAQEWSELTSGEPSEEPYLLCYFVTLTQSYIDHIKAIKKSTGLKAIWLCGNRKGPNGFKKIMDAGPSEFLSLFKYASFVCTNSFHGTVFSVIFGREFVCFSNHYQYNTVEAGSNMLNSRVFTLLDKLGLADRLIPLNLEASINDVIKGFKPLDYERVTLGLEEERKASFAFLKVAITSPTMSQ